MICISSSSTENWQCSWLLILYSKGWWKDLYLHIAYSSCFSEIQVYTDTVRMFLFDYSMRHLRKDSRYHHMYIQRHLNINKMSKKPLIDLFKLLKMRSKITATSNKFIFVLKEYQVNFKQIYDITVFTYICISWQYLIEILHFTSRIKY